jgi:hypothetical protein
MLSISPTKLTEGSSITIMLQFSVITQVRERSLGQLSPFQEQSTWILLVSGFNKKLPEIEGIKVHNVNTGKQDFDALLLQKFRKRLD